jgi:hypothetical protein
MRLPCDACYGLWLLLNLAWASATLRSCLKILRTSQRSRPDWVASDRESVRFWIKAVRGWHTAWLRQTFTQEVAVS